MQKIYHGDWHEFLVRKAEGKEQIGEVLISLNDTVRLCSHISPALNPIRNLKEVPQISTPYWQVNNNALENIGNLIIVDTPGPNEAGAYQELHKTVVDQLKKSSVVLIVLDFTQLKNKASEEVKIEVQKVIEVRGKDNLYILVNKIDQRRENDMSSEEILQFVRAEFDLDEQVAKNRIFEIAALWAYSATSFLAETRNSPFLTIENSKTARALAQSALGARWEHRLSKTSIDKLKEEAQYLWEESNFPVFLSSAIEELMKQVAPRSIKSALEITDMHLREVKDSVDLRRSGLEKSAAELQIQIDAILKDIDDLDKVKNKVPDVLDIKRNLQKKSQIV